MRRDYKCTFAIATDPTTLARCLCIFFSLQVLLNWVCRSFMQKLVMRIYPVVDFLRIDFSLLRYVSLCMCFQGNVCKLSSVLFTLSIHLDLNSLKDDHKQIPGPGKAVN